MNSTVDFAILAPVPEEHLDSGLEVCQDTGFVAFGSTKWELFGEIDRLRGHQPVPVLIYPSDEDAHVPFTYLIKWVGWYVGHVRSNLGAHPDGMIHRPPTTSQYAGDISGHWAVFWHVAELRKLADGDFQPISSLQSEKSGRYWKAGSPPRGPELVARPDWF